MDNSQCEPCKARDKINTPTHLCVICEEALCLECTENHRVQKMSRCHELIDIETKPTHINISDQRCSKHDNMPFEYFCIDHDTLFCKECQVESHRVCQKVMSVDIASKGAKRSQSFIDAVELTENILRTISSISDDRHSFIENIEKEANAIENEIRKLKEEVISQIESIEKSLLEDLELKKDKIVSIAKETLNQMQEIEKMTKERKDTFDMVEKHGTEKQTFLTVHAYKIVLINLENRISAFTEMTTRSKMKFNPNALQKLITSFGEIEILEVPTDINFCRPKKCQSQIPVFHQESVPRFVQKKDMNIGNSLTVVGITINDQDELITTFNRLGHKTLKNSGGIRVYDHNGILYHILDTTYVPRQIALIPDTNKGVVTFYNLNFIQFVDFEKKTFLNKVSLEESRQGGVAASTVNIFIGLEGRIAVLDLNGSYTHSIEINNKELIPRYISLGSNGNIYYSDSKIVCCMRDNGEILFIYQPQDKNKPYGISIDSQGYVYVAVDYKGVCRLRPDGTFADIVVHEGCLPLQDICFNKNGKKLYTSYRHGVLVYNQQ